MLRCALILAAVLCALPARAEVADDPLAYIAAIYNVYRDGHNNSGVEPRYSRRMQALRDADAKATPQGEAGTIDWDLFVNGNDWDVTELKIVLEEKSAACAKVHASFKSFKQPQDIVFDLVREDGCWVIDDIASIRVGKRWTMSKILTHAPDAFPDEKADVQK